MLLWDELLKYEPAVPLKLHGVRHTPSRSNNLYTLTRQSRKGSTCRKTVFFLSAQKLQTTNCISVAYTNRHLSEKPGFALLFVNAFKNLMWQL